MPESSVFNNILTIGPNHYNHKGGIGAVISLYHKNIRNFNFIPSYDGNRSHIGNLILFFKSIILLIWKLVAERNVKIVHIHGSSKGSFYRKYIIFLITKSVFGKRIIYHLHGSEFHLFYQNSDMLTRYLVKRLVAGADHIFCLSGFWLDFFESSFHVKRISVLNNPIELPLTQHLKSNEIKNECLSLLFLGRIGERKGIFDLLNAISLNREVFKGKLKLKIGGDGETHRLIDLIDKLNLANYVEYVGWVDSESKRNLLKNCDILILPSYNEGLPISILEGMSYGKPIISTPVGGISEIVKDGFNGYLFTPGDLKALTAILLNIVDSEVDLIQLGNNSLDIVKNYDINYVKEHLKKEYLNIINRQ